MTPFLTLLAIKALIVLALVGAVLAGWKGWRYNGALDGIASAIMGAAMLPFVGVCFAAAIYGVYFLFT